MPRNNNVLLLFVTDCVSNPQSSYLQDSYLGQLPTILPLVFRHCCMMTALGSAASAIVATPGLDDFNEELKALMAKCKLPTEVQAFFKAFDCLEPVDIMLSLIHISEPTRPY